MFANMADGDKPQASGDGSKKADKRMSVERIYQKKSQLEHILLRPDTYVGSIEAHVTSMWVMNEDQTLMEQKEITYVPGLYKIFDEILVNASDNKQRDKNMDTIKIDIDAENNRIKIWNNGKGIPVVEHKVEKMFVPTLIFGHLLTSSNYDDDQKKVTGGRNGYGAKLCNIFSKKFTVETSDKSSGKCFRQSWTGNMGKASEPKIGVAKTSDFTCVTFEPDLTKFKMEKLDEGIVALFTRRAYDIAAATRGVKVVLNGKRLPVKSFKDYIDLYLKDKVDDNDAPLKVVYEQINPRWEVAVALSAEKGFQQVSFVNSIATTKGGRHVDYIVDQIAKKLGAVIQRKSGKGGVAVKPFQIKNNMWVFVNCLIENPSFDSQTKENMTLQSKQFGSKCELSEKYITSVSKSGIVEHILNWVKFKALTQMNKKCSSSKHSKLKGIPKLDDANEAGTKNSERCTLILTEGDSAKTLAVAGLSVIGRDFYGVFPLKGKLLNTREATHKQLLENAEINNLIKILGLHYKFKYNDYEEVKKLRYGKVMIMTDQDQDGSHIKGLLINFIHHNWPNLLKHNFLVEFITPIVKATKSGKEISFFSLPEFEEWKVDTDNWHTYKIKYYKGLGTSTSKEAKEYFTDMPRHKIPFRYSGSADDTAIELAFSKKCIEDRKSWLTNWMEQRKQRIELGISEAHLYGKNTSRITYSEFVNKELVLFSNLDNERSIPSLVDGFKPGQRKVMFTCIKRNLIKELKVAQLAGSVAEISAYHHGENSLMSTIIGLAQDFVGSNNLNLLQPIGQFGTRLHGGSDSASSRYIFTALSEVTRLILHPHDDAVLRYMDDDGTKIEPFWYCPILPMVLINGATGIGTGWSTSVPNYNVQEVMNNVRNLIKDKPIEKMLPSYRGFRGQYDDTGEQRIITSGEVAVLDEGTVEITELPVKVWTQSYKESVLEPMLQGTDKVPAVILDYKEYHTDITVRFIVKMSPENFRKAEAAGLHNFFKLQKPISLSNFVLFDSAGVLRKYETVESIFQEFYNTRLGMYVKRKDYLDGMLDAEARKLSNQARFILEKIDGKIPMENKKKVDVISMLSKMGFESDPIKSWKESQLQDGEIEEEEGELVIKTGNKEPDYNYLVNMPMMNLSREKKEELLKQRDNKMQELKVLRGKTSKDLWLEDLDALVEGLKKVEQKLAKERQEILDKAAAKGGKFKNKKNETLPSKFGTRVPPTIPEVKKPAKPRVKKEDPKQNKLDSFLTKDGESPAIEGKVKPKTEPKPKTRSPITKTRKPRSPKKDTPSKSGARSKTNPWDTESDENDGDFSISSAGSDDDDVAILAPKQTTKRTAAKLSEDKSEGSPVAKKTALSDKPTKNVFSSDEDDDIITQSPPKNEKKAEPSTAPTTKTTSKTTAKNKPAANRTKTKQTKKDLKQSTLNFKKKAETIDLSDSDDDDSPPVKKPAAKSGASKRKKPALTSDSESDSQPKKKNGKVKDDDSDAISDIDLAIDSPVVPRDVTGRSAAAKAKYNFSSDESDW